MEIISLKFCFELSGVILKMFSKLFHMNGMVYLSYEAAELFKHLLEIVRRIDNAHKQMIFSVQVDTNLLIVIQPHTTGIGPISLIVR
jgi:hypothetical protein